jgi:hypothetical protein
MKIKLITSYKPGCWEQYGKKGIEAMAKQFPAEIDIVVYAEEAIPKCDYDRITWIDLNLAEPNLTNFKDKHKNDPVANGKLEEIQGGVRRIPELQKLGGADKNKESFLWDAVRFSNKVFCVINAVRNSKDYDYVVWLDADTFTFRPVPIDFLEKLLPANTMVTYLGRENPKLNDGGKYPECGFVGYNLNHPETQNFINEWELLYTQDTVFKILEWHDSYVFWHLTKKFRTGKNIQVNDIGKWVGVKGHHVFVNSELGQYIDHMKGDRKTKGSSSQKDLKTNITNIDYWKKVPYN